MNNNAAIVEVKESSVVIAIDDELKTINTYSGITGKKHIKYILDLVDQIDDDRVKFKVTDCPTINTFLKLKDSGFFEFKRLEVTEIELLTGRQIIIKIRDFPIETKLSFMRPIFKEYEFKLFILYDETNRLELNRSQFINLVTDIREKEALIDSLFILSLSAQQELLVHYNDLKELETEVGFKLQGNQIKVGNKYIINIHNWSTFVDVYNPSNESKFCVFTNKDLSFVNFIKTLIYSLKDRHLTTNLRIESKG